CETHRVGRIGATFRYFERRLPRPVDRTEPCVVPTTQAQWQVLASEIGRDDTRKVAITCGLEHDCTSRTKLRCKQRLQMRRILLRPTGNQMPRRPSEPRRHGAVRLRIAVPTEPGTHGFQHLLA